MPAIDRKKPAIVRVLDIQGEPLGSSRLGQEIAKRGVHLTHGPVRYQLQQLDEAGLTESLGREGRCCNIMVVQMLHMEPRYPTYPLNLQHFSLCRIPLEVLAGVLGH